MSQDSRDAYAFLVGSKTLAKHHAKVLNVFIKENRPLGAMDLIDLLFHKYNSPMINPSVRISELTQMGFLIKLPRIDKENARWEYSGRTEPLPGHELIRKRKIPVSRLEIKDSRGNPVIEIGAYQVMRPTIDGKVVPYGGHWISRADPPAEGEGFFCEADELVKLLDDFYQKNF